MAFKKYTRTNVAEMRDIENNETMGQLLSKGVSISTPDQNLSSEEFKKGKVARNPENHEDRWYVARDYFDRNFKEVKE